MVLRLFRGNIGGTRKTPAFDDDRRPDHVVYGYDDQTLLTDVSVVFPETATSVGQKEKEKIDKYPLQPSSGFVFEPLIASAYGAWGPRALQVMKKVSLLAIQRGSVFAAAEDFQRFHWKVLSIAVQKASYEMVRLYLQRSRRSACRSLSQPPQLLREVLSQTSF